jgi:hypothetical protein
MFGGFISHFKLAWIKGSAWQNSKTRGTSQNVPSDVGQDSGLLHHDLASSSDLVTLLRQNRALCASRKQNAIRLSFQMFDATT